MSPFQVSGNTGRPRGTVFFTILPDLIYTIASWSIFDFDAGSPNRHGEQRSASDAIVSTGVYILLREGKCSFMLAISSLKKY